MKIIKLCQDQQLPLMREQYTFKMSFDQRKEINPLIIDNARLYIEDMVNVILKLLLGAKLIFYFLTVIKNIK